MRRRTCWTRLFPYGSSPSGFGVYSLFSGGLSDRCLPGFPGESELIWIFGADRKRLDCAYEAVPLQPCLTVLHHPPTAHQAGLSLHPYECHPPVPVHSELGVNPGAQCKVPCWYLVTHLPLLITCACKAKIRAAWSKEVGFNVCKWRCVIVEIEGNGTSSSIDGGACTTPCVGYGITPIVVPQKVCPKGVAAFTELISVKGGFALLIGGCAFACIVIVFVKGVYFYVLAVKQICPLFLAFPLICPNPSSG